jgi:hypothetical protein
MLLTRKKSCSFYYKWWRKKNWNDWGRIE